MHTMENPLSVMVWSSLGPGYRLTPTYQNLADLKFFFNIYIVVIKVKLKLTKQRVLPQYVTVFCAITLLALKTAPLKNRPV